MISKNLHYVKSILILFFVLSVLNTCKKENKEERKIIENLHGKTFPFPEEVIVFNNPLLDTISISHFDADIKIVSTIDGRCGACVEHLSELMEVKKKIEQNSKYDIDFLFFVFTKDFATFKKEFYPLLENEEPVIIQKDLSFLEENPLPGFGVYQTVLTINNEVRLVGDPAFNKELEKLYIDEINSYKK